MKTQLIILLLALIVSVSNLSAQPNDGENYGYRGISGDRAGYMSDYLNSRLSLTDDQYNNVYRIFLNHEMQRDEDFEKYSDDRNAFRDASDKRRAKLDSDLKEVLTSEQYEKYEQMRSGMYNKMKSKFGRHKGRRNR